MEIIKRHVRAEKASKETSTIEKVTGAPKSSILTTLVKINYGNVVRTNLKQKLKKRKKWRLGMEEGKDIDD